MRAAAVLPLLALAFGGLLGGCDRISGDGATTGERVSAGERLEDEAIAVGIIPDPARMAFVGRFEHRGDLGIDKFCAVTDGERRAKVGLLAIFGDASHCEARGSAVWDGELVNITLDGRGDCAIKAHFDGVVLQLPGNVPRGCAAYCSARASFAGVSYFLVDPGDNAARSVRGRAFDRLCAAS